MANRTENVGIFTAYGFAREGGYVGTKAEFEEGLAKSANYATNAQASATAAANSATSASTMATAAASSAGAAAGSANTAAGYAQDADEFAQAAAASADEAEGYAESIDPDQFAKIDGYYGTLKSGESDTADNLTPYSSDSGTSQNTPFIDQGSGCANGEEQADTGSYCQLKEKRGNTVVVNQLINPADFAASDSDFINGVKFTNNEDGSVTITVTEGGATASRFYNLYSTRWTFPAHKIYGGQTPENIAFCNSYSGTQTVFSNTVYTNTYTGSQQFRPVIWVKAGCAAGTYKIYPKLLDLTLWYGSNDKIPAHLLNHPEDFFRYYQGDLSYNVGTLTDCNGRYLKTIGRNVWDEEWEDGYISSDGVEGSYAKAIRSKNFCSCIPNTYYKYLIPIGMTGHAICWYDADKNFIVRNADASLMRSPANACFFKLSMYNYKDFSPSYNHDITISLYYEGESGYDQYYPYEELANIDTGNEELLAFDYKTPDGTIHRDTGKYTFNGNETAQNKTEKTNCDRYLFYNILSSPSISDNVAKAITDNGFVVGNAYSNDVPMLFEPSGNSIYITVPTSASPSTYFKSGTVIEYELADASKTTEQGTPFPENVAIDDFGTMEFDCPNGVPQGNTVFYPVDYKAEIDTLHNITEGDMHKIALKGDLAEGDPETIEEVIDYINARIPAPPAEDGTYNLTVTVASGEATYSWVSTT